MHDVFAALRTQKLASVSRLMRDSASNNSKDVLAAAFLLTPLPLTKERFAEVQTNDYVRVKLIILDVDRVDGNNYGWSKAPYDNKKKLDRSELKPLYTVDAEGPHAGQTRFWSYKKVSNNMNKGERVDHLIVDAETKLDKETSFALPPNTCLSFFIRELDYEHRFFDTSVFGDNSPAELEAYSPVVLHLSGMNVNQAVQGNGLKLRRISAVMWSNTFPTSIFGNDGQKEETLQWSAILRHAAICTICT